ncbi:complement factor H-like isoform X3 [Bufo gargarizans]|uniref:complement factor H-like isoform X3 n=1 Tax=Bufo gargarizans TaxID=30331 RepID=UPI001CF118A9|nr:complement factor H-like isoform X3 [Bufo gargarizans]
MISAGTCKAPGLENGRHVLNKVLFEVGEWLQYHCDEGYMTAERNIVENVQCLSSGWSAVPQCSGIVCSFQPKRGSDKLHLVYSSGPVAKFSCNDGFILKGSEISQCYYYGWDPPLPTCQDSGERVKCPPPPQLMNTHEITLKSVYFSGDKEIIKCKPGFQLYGAQLVICKNGRWTSPPQCVLLQECDDPPSILFGALDSASRKPAYHSGSVVMYKCNDGFEMTGLNEIICIMGKWSSPPTCISDGCPLSKETMITRGIALENAPAQISEGESVEFHCIGNMVPSQSLMVTCKDGKIHYPQCVNPDSDSCQLSKDKIAQNNLVLPKSASVGKAYRNGDRILTQCKSNYFRASPSLIVECLNGKMIYPKCAQENGCPLSKATMITRGIALENAPAQISEGESVEFHCIGNMVPSQSLMVTCKDGKIHYPQCVNPDSDSCQLSTDKIAQNNLVLPKSASVGKAYRNGDRILTRCKSNYFRASPSLIVECLNGKMIYPKCAQEKPCRINQDILDENFLEFDPNYDYKVYFEDGEIIHFVCKAGYTTITETTGLCVKEDIIFPVCHEILQCIISIKQSHGLAGISGIYFLCHSSTPTAQYLQVWGLII